MNSPLVRRLFSNAQASLEKTLPAPQTQSIQPGLKQEQKAYNPFLSAMNTDSAAYRETYGVNRPLSKPMFLGYRDNKAMYGGSRLFILY